MILTFSKSVHPSVVSASAETTDGHEDRHLSVQPELQLGSSRQDTFGIEACVRQSPNNTVTQCYTEHSTHG